ncbi:MAG TPA: DUF1501 domain-containing protein [Anaerolineales bacterium]|jgi:uncharacterized protein (DUF1501 family)|nr:hypothetical protein [Anaerolineae bacterium]HRJ58013.1 DUF1501 domain-containing protein [Anaerolineales bacterium]HRK90397.1 DUF1501 domain-containing protein [Anaerolineales bacterium]
MTKTILPRRQFLQGCSAAIAAMAGAKLTNIAFARQDNPSDTLVVVFLRGGWDALNVVAPIEGDDRGFYEKARPDIRIQNLLRLNDQFGMHPAMSPLYDLYQAGRVGVVHAVGLNVDTRSHFDAQEYIELGTPGSKNTASGWITRHLQASGISSILPVLSTSGMPTSLLNFVPTVSLSTPEEFSLWDNGLRDSHINALRQMYAGESLLHRAGARTLDALDIVSPLSGGYEPSNGAYYNNDEFGIQLKTVAQMIKLDAGLRVATVDFGGWDTHEYQNSGDGGYMADLLNSLASGLANFYLDLDSGYTDKLSVVVVSEFGRRLVQNESYGTDHGHGSVMFTLGGSVNGGQVFGNWPGLHNDQLYDRADLAVTTDYRQVLGELLSKRGNNADIESVFPGFSGSYNPLGIFR